MNFAITTAKAHQIRNQAAATFGGKASDYSWAIALQMAGEQTSVAAFIEDRNNIKIFVTVQTAYEHRKGMAIPMGIRGEMITCHKAYSDKAALVGRFSNSKAYSEAWLVAFGGIKAVEAAAEGGFKRVQIVYCHDENETTTAPDVRKYNYVRDMRAKELGIEIVA